MNRLFFVLPFVFLAGCRMGASPYDYCVPAYTHRADDYRGCDAFYRAGSIFWNGNGADVNFVADRSMNAGNFGVTTPVDTRRPGPRTLEPRKLDRPSIGIPPRSATPTPNNENGLRPAIEDVPGLPEIPATPPLAIPPILPDLPTTPPSTIPSGLTPIPFDQSQSPSAPVITIEELRRLDPSVTDVRILSVEDAPNPKTGSPGP